jgi:hypothetical protein
MVRQETMARVQREYCTNGVDACWKTLPQLDAIEEIARFHLEISPDGCCNVTEAEEPLIPDYEPDPEDWVFVDHEDLNDNDDNDEQFCK